MSIAKMSSSWSSPSAEAKDGEEEEGISILVVLFISLFLLAKICESEKTLRKKKSQSV